MCTITLCDDWHFVFYFGCYWGLTALGAGGLEGHFLLLRENGQERIS